jgi:hypothetical protein
MLLKKYLRASGMGPIRLIRSINPIHDGEARDYITSPGLKARGCALDSPAREIV